MSSTTTSTRTTTHDASLALDGILADYELHHSQLDIPEARRQSPASRRQAPTPPVEWDTTHRRVPPYRPINRDRDPMETRVYTSRVEQMFIITMFTGVLINSVSCCCHATP